MKKFNANIILFVLALLFVLGGFTAKYMNDLRYILISFVVQNDDAAEDIPAMLNKVDNVTTKEIRYHDFLMNINSVKLRMTNERLIQKDKILVVKTEEESLVERKSEITLEQVQTSLEVITELQQCAQNNGASFLYIAAPNKEVCAKFPSNVVNYSPKNYELFVSELEKADVPILDLKNDMETEGIFNNDSYFSTDHHWKPEIGFWATGKICAALQNQYGFGYDPELTDISNYSVKVYEDWFLGSYGKKVGLHFTSSGADDISLIIPNFETNLTDLQPYKDLERTGKFEESALYIGHINKKNYYGLSPYVAYGGGDYRLQILKNNLNPDGDKIVILRDSFACVVTPFLALNAGEIHCIDTRSILPYEEIDVYAYIEEIQPDYVLVLFNGPVADTAERLNLN